MKKGYLLVFSTAIISGFSVFVNKFGVSAVNPNIYTFLKVLVVAIFLTGLLLFLKDWQKLKSLTKKQWFLLMIIGFVGGSVPFLFFFEGLSMTNAAQGSFIHKTMFIWVTFLAALFLAAENTISKYALRDLEGRIVAWARMFFGALFILIFLSATNQLSLILNLNLEQISWVLITAVIL